MTLQEQELAADFARLTGEAARDPLDTRTLLATVAAGGSRLFGASGAMVQYAPVGRAPVQAHGTDEALTLLAVDAVEWREGPGYDTRTTGCALIDVDVTKRPVRTRWPRWVPRARALGLGRVTALPLRAEEGAGGTVGALVLLGAPGSSLDEGALVVVRTFAEAAGHTLSLQRELTESRVLAGQLEHALSSRVVVEQAKGLLAARHGITLDAAFDRLRRHARSRQRKVADVAREITEGGDPTDQ
ncbi:ANTAR domain-containing protein [Streptomyces sp. NPDC050095]|uniref:ANTAR domain-containing response regulator n=1 Tax=unclassified Streptomyces TaxID=2593676 RepID=UPI00343DB630